MELGGKGSIFNETTQSSVPRNLTYQSENINPTQNLNIFYNITNVEFPNGTL